MGVWVEAIHGIDLLRMLRDRTADGYVDIVADAESLLGEQGRTSHIWVCNVAK